MRPCSSQSRRPSRGHRSVISRSTASSVPAAATSSRAAPSTSPRSTPGTSTVTAMTRSHRGRAYAQHAGQVFDDELPGLALVGARVDLAGAGAEVDPGDLLVVRAEGVAQHDAVVRLLRQAVAQPAPRP